ncbi:MAG: HD-GYP domain-containing protein [Candidatus Aminicenantes bacterium]|nr:HD-GYP domain-containing protein [Candidatus Aminicenantes bacterium]
MAKHLVGLFKNIRSKVTIFVLLLLTAVTLASYAVMIHIMRDRVLNEVLKRAGSLTRSIASVAGYNFISQDLLGLDTLVFRVKSSNQDVESIAIIDIQDMILVHSDLNKARETYTPASGSFYRASGDGTSIRLIKDHGYDVFEIASPVVFMNRNLGKVVLSINKTTIYAAQKQVQRNIALVFAVILLVGIIGSIILSSFLTRPIKELNSGVEELKHGKNSDQLKIYSQDELGRLTQSFNEMSLLITTQREELSKYAEDLEKSYVATVKVLSAAIEARDHYTLGHSTRVAKLSVEIGKEMNLIKEQLEDLEIACLFHDVGKIKIPDSILLKKGKLNASEYREMKRHPEYGAEILSKASSLLKYIPAVKHHHEWFNGAGYPDGLSSKKIPVSAAIISLADVFDAMTSDRPYRKALSVKESLRIIRGLAGIQFAPDHVEIFLKLYAL